MKSEKIIHLLPPTFNSHRSSRPPLPGGCSSWPPGQLGFGKSPARRVKPFPKTPKSPPDLLRNRRQNPNRKQLVLARPPLRSNGVPLQGTDSPPPPLRNPSYPSSSIPPPLALPLRRLARFAFPGPDQAVRVPGQAVHRDAGGVRGGAAGVGDGVRREHVLLHHGGAGL